ncbi:septation protein SepH [Brevibacterium samyangense]|uniref:Septation protein SepH n=1 Tax=Brevibacterium samyangense TaxID=366888 RepID=A0ABN2TE70_9MICO
MLKLTLRGVHEDEEHLVLRDPEGREFLLPIDEGLYAAVRRDRSRLSQIQAAGEAVRPKDIQAMIRSGMTSAEVAEATGADLSHVQQYEHPVLAERAHIAQRAGRSLVYPENDPDRTPKQLLVLARERLAMREVDLDTMSWDAWKKNTGVWYVELRFIAAGKERRAGWEFARGSVNPVDDEAKWLSDAGPTDSGPIPNFGTAQERVFNIESDGGRTAVHEERSGRTVSLVDHRSTHEEETGRILESLRRRRGRHLTGVASEAPAPQAPTTPPAPKQFGLRAVSDTPPAHPDGAHTALGAPEDAVDAGILARPAKPGAGQDTTARPAGGPDDRRGAPGRASDPASAPVAGSASAPHGDSEPQPTLPIMVRPDANGEETAPATGGANGSADDGARRKGRASVPSWDEIMFGAKRD